MSGGMLDTGGSLPHVQGSLLQKRVVEERGDSGQQVWEETMSEQVREAIRSVLKIAYDNGFCAARGMFYTQGEDVLADRILSLTWSDGSPMLAATDLDQHLPENPYDVGPYNYYLHGKSNSYYQAQQDMLKAGWIRAEGG